MKKLLISLLLFATIEATAQNNLPSKVPDVEAFRGHPLRIVFDFPTGFDLSDSIYVRLQANNRDISVSPEISVGDSTVTLDFPVETVASLPAITTYSVYFGDYAKLGGTIKPRWGSGAPGNLTFNVSESQGVLFAVSLPSSETLARAGAAADSAEASAELAQAYADSSALYAAQVPVYVRNISTTNISNWNSAYGLVGSTVNLTGAQTVAGVKTFSSAISHAGSVVPTADITTNLGSSSMRYATVYTATVNFSGGSLVIRSTNNVGITVNNNGTVVLSSVPTYSDNAAATTGGLAVGTIYKTSTGVLMIRY